MQFGFWIQKTHSVDDTSTSIKRWNPGASSKTNGKVWFLLPPGHTGHLCFATSLEGACGHMAGMTPKECQHRDMNLCQAGQEKDPSNNPHALFLIAPFWSSRGSDTLMKLEPQDGNKLGLWLTSWWTPPWNLCGLEINYIVLSHWYGGESLSAAAIITLTKTAIPPFSLPFPIFIPSEGLSPRNIWI